MDATLHVPLSAFCRFQSFAEIHRSCIVRFPEDRAVKPGVAERAWEKLCEKYAGLRVVGCGDGYFREDAPVLARLRESGARLILVCLGFPRQELWMAAHRNEVGDALMLGVGGSMDVFAGDVKRAPEAWCKAGLEWLYRLISQPSRIKRMIKLPIFLMSVVLERIKHGKADRI